ncbi:MAG: nitroreductase family deazaflavin-dependent oxidoreductase [Gammaproteobacteria bacterium]|nr:nitroreductase family deazaflavin-dependent oxidoreductase [Gammaproteobacteria bacterium]
MRIPDLFFVIINPTVRLLLRSPLHRFWSHSLMLITFTGRSSGRVYTTPVRYLRSGDAIWAFTSVENQWWRNLGNGAPVRLRLQGSEHAYRAEAITDAPERVRAALAEFLVHFPQDAPYYDIRMDAERHPLGADLDRAATRTVWVQAYLQ